MDGATPVGQQIDDYAGQVADINRKISGFFRAGAPPESPGDKQAYEGLKAQRDAIHAKAKDLTARTKSAGAEAPDFFAAVKKASKESMPPNPEEARTAIAETSPPAATPEEPKPNPLADVRKKYPQYADVPDDKLAD